MADTEPFVGSTRRFYLLKRQTALASGDDALSAVWQAKQDAEPGADLPESFPFLSRLTTAGYSTVEDLNGANDDELLDQSFTSSEATAIFAALAPLL